MNVNYGIFKNKKKIVICEIEFYFYFFLVDEKQLICNSSMILVKSE